jgi:DNA-binding NarL/FixJ family response regulator
VLILSNRDEALFAERFLRAAARSYVLKDRPPAIWWPRYARPDAAAAARIASGLCDDIVA